MSSYAEEYQKEINKTDENTTKNIEKIDRYYLDDLKKATTKSPCTRSTKKLFELMDSDLSSKRHIRNVP